MVEVEQLSSKSSSTAQFSFSRKTGPLPGTANSYIPSVELKSKKREKRDCIKKKQKRQQRGRGHEYLRDADREMLTILHRLNIVTYSR